MYTVSMLNVITLTKKRGKPQSVLFISTPVRFASTGRRCRPLAVCGPGHGDVVAMLLANAVYQVSNNNGGRDTVFVDRYKPTERNQTVSCAGYM
ncbi:uncharacterized protein V6R79_005372 [Siganus canaliculatus]